MRNMKKKTAGQLAGLYLKANNVRAPLGGRLDHLTNSFVEGGYLVLRLILMLMVNDHDADDQL